jgi:COP9 signalosome complex subunit 3
MGLVAQVVDTFSGHAIIRLRKTFAALTVAEVLEQSPYMPADPMAAESVIASLIMSGAMNAELVHSSSHTCDTMLRLPGKSFSSQMSHESHVQVRLKEEGPLMTALMGSLEVINRAMGLSDDLVDSSKGQTRTATSDLKQGLGDDYGLDIDEDIMGG